MRYSLRDRLMDLVGSLPLRLGRLGRRGRRESLPVVRGNMRRVIVVQPPDPMFTQAMFILRDDYFQTPGVSSQELLRQAREAARDYVDQAIPADPVRPVFPTAMSVFALGAAAAIFALWLGGVI